MAQLLRTVEEVRRVCSQAEFRSIEDIHARALEILRRYKVSIRLVARALCIPFSSLQRAASALQTKRSPYKNGRPTVLRSSEESKIVCYVEEAQQQMRPLTMGKVLAIVSTLTITFLDHHIICNSHCVEILIGH